MSSFAETAMDHKNGFVMGLGLNIGSYRFPVEFEGETKNKIDESATTAGPSLQLGYDVLIKNHLLIGVRAEGMLSDTSGMNKDKNKEIYDHTKGKNRTVMGLVRVGFVADFVGTNLVDEKYHMTAEFFLEGGIGTGKNDFTKKFTYNKGGVTENYKESIQETFSSQVLCGGFNVTSGGGAFFETKILYQTFISNHVKREGSFLVNNGTQQPISGSESDTKPDPFTAVVLTIGHHY